MKCLRAAVLLLGMTACAAVLPAQEPLIEAIGGRDSSQRAGRIDEAYLRDWADHLIVRTYFTRRISVFDLAPSGLPYDVVRYEPNVPTNFGVGFNWRWLGLGLSVPLRIGDAETTKYGRTRHFDLVIQAYPRRWVLDAYVQRYRGHYIANPADVLPGYNTSGPFPQRADVRTLSMGVNGAYVFNHRRFSFRAAFNQTEQQRRSAGSWLVLPSVAFYDLNADSLLLPNLTPDATPDLRLRHMRLYTVGLLGGYGHNFVWRQFYLHLTGAVGGSAGLRRLEWDGRPDRDNQVVLVPRANLRFGVGYFGAQWYGGLAGVTDWYGTALGPDLRFAYQVTSVSVYVGRRFGTRGMSARP